MSRKAQNRAEGIKLGRLPGYNVKSDGNLEKLPEAVAFRTDVVKFVTRKAAIRVNGSVAANDTIKKSKEILGEMASRLWRLGFKLKSLEGLNGKHIEAIVRDHWACGSSLKHMAAVVTELNKLDDWINKPGLVKSKEIYLPEVDPQEFQISMVAGKSKSWSENGLDVNLKIAQADRKDKRFGLMLRMCLALGLRRCEVLQIVPWRDDRLSYFDIRAGIAKGGRARTIPYLSSAQKQVVDYVKTHLKRDEHLGWTDGKEKSVATLVSNKNLYSRYMAEIGITKYDSGVTGHGLRAEYAEDMSLLLGLVPATLGGTKGQMSREDEDIIRLQVSENMGHSRTNVTNAYYGKLTKKIQNSRGERLGAIGLNDRKMSAIIFMNPPPKPGSNGEYPRLQKRTLETTDITVALEFIEEGLYTEVAEFSFKESEETMLALLQELQADMFGDALQGAADLKRIGNVLLAKFGVVMPPVM